ncbi:MAG: aconitate hydratase, partial [Chloroflexi bacterium]|nr:aconitate hydratase [Chloroflexota bacterium]
VIVGSCTNGSYHDMVVFVGALEAFGGRVAPGLDAIVAPSSFAGAQRFVEEGYGARLFRTGARLSESTCGACLGVGHVPAPGSVSVRTFNRNFSGRSGLPRDRVYLSSPVTAAAAATGRLVDPRTLAKGAAAPRVAVRGPWPEPGPGLLAPATPEEARALRPRRPGGLASVPMLDAMPRTLRVRVVCRLGDDVSTDDIQPSSTIMLWRADPAAAARTILGPLVPDLPDRCDAALSACGAAALVAGHNYGQGSSREQAALGQRLLGIRLVIASSIARIHRQNLINFGVLPCVWDAPGDPQAPAAGAGDAVQPGDVLVIEDLDRQLLDAPPAGGTIVAWHEGRQCAVTLRHDLNAYEREVVLAGGFLNHLRDHPVQDSTANSIRDAGG